MEEQKEKLANMFMDWFNNFLTYERFAEYYDISVPEAKQIINLGRKYHNERATK